MFQNFPWYLVVLLLHATDFLRLHQHDTVILCDYKLSTRTNSSRTHSVRECVSANCYCGKYNATISFHQPHMRIRSGFLEFKDMQHFWCGCAQRGWKAIISPPLHVLHMCFVHKSDWNKHSVMMCTLFKSQSSCFSTPAMLHFRIITEIDYGWIHILLCFVRCHRGLSFDAATPLSSSLVHSFSLNLFPTLLKVSSTHFALCKICRNCLWIITEENFYEISISYV